VSRARLVITIGGDGTLLTAAHHIEDGVALAVNSAPEDSVGHFIAHDHPAATSRYRLTVGERDEEHRSSGLWIATAAGSTAGIRSSGGRPMPLRSPRLQNRVRELYREPGREYTLEAGFLGRAESLTVDSKMEEGHVFIDGARTAYRFRFGVRLVVRTAKHPLRLFADPSRWASR